MAKIISTKHFTFDRIHEVIQEAFGWQDYHLYQFSPKGFGSYTQIAVIYENCDKYNTEDSKNEKNLLFV